MEMSNEPILLGSSTMLSSSLKGPTRGLPSAAFAQTWMSTCRGFRSSNWAAPPGMRSMFRRLMLRMLHTRQRHLKRQVRCVVKCT